MNSNILILCYLFFIFQRIINVGALGRRYNASDRMRKWKQIHSGVATKENKGLRNFEILKNTDGVSNIELNSKTFFDIIANTRLVQRPGNPASPPPIYRYVPNMHDKNENIGASLVFLIFGLLLFFVLFFLFYCIFKSYVKHIKAMKS